MKSIKEPMLSSGQFAQLLGRPKRTVKRWMADAYRSTSFEICRTSGGRYRIPLRIAKIFLTTDEAQLATM